MKQTSVEWLINQHRLLLLCQDSLMKENKYFQKLDFINEEAKKMEKWQITKAWCDGAMSIEEENAEDYYNSTFQQ